MLARLTTIAFVALLCAPAGGCHRKREFKGETDYAVPERSEEDLSVAMRTRCRAAKAAGKPLLVEFSARWCPDCRALATLKEQPPLSEALAQVELLEINVGNFDRHPALLAFFDVDRIATWVMLRPEVCETPIFSWPRVGRRVVEPESSPVAVSELAAWVRAGGAMGAAK